MSNEFVGIVMGSDSDFPTVKPAVEILKELGVTVEVRVTSAHRTPENTHHYIKDADQRGCQVFIAAAGMAAHLAGTVAALTCKPVIGIPIDSGPLQGLDALLSTSQMPGGVPVATVSIGKAGAKNAGILAAQIMGLSNPELAERLQQQRENNKEAVLEKNRKLQESL